MTTIQKPVAFDGADVRGIDDAEFVKRYPGVSRTTGPDRKVCFAMPHSEELIAINIDSGGLYAVPKWFEMIHGVSSINGNNQTAFLSSRRYTVRRDQFHNQWYHQFVVNLDGVQAHDSRVDEPKKFVFQMGSGQGV